MIRSFMITMLPTMLIHIFEGLKPVLDKIKSLGINIAIASNKPDYPTKKVVSSFFGEDYFACVLGQREGVPLKPEKMPNCLP